MSDRAFQRAVTDWLEDGSDRTPSHAINGVLLAVKTTPQERDLRIPWRIPMPAYARALAAVAIVVVVSAGGLIFLNNQAPSGVGGQSASPTNSAAPSVSPSDAASPSPAEPSIDAPAGFVPYTSPVYGYTLAYPEGWNAHPAAAEGDEDIFGSGDDELGVALRAAPAGDGADLASIEGLTAWAKADCAERSLGACETYADRVEPMCLATDADPCRPAIFVRSVGTNPEDEAEIAYFGDWAGATPGSAPDTVVILGTGRGDTYPAAAPFGGAAQLLKTMLATMGVTPKTAIGPGPSEVATGINAWTPFTSPVYGYTLSYPEGWNASPATRAWLSSDGPGLNDTSDIFVNPANDVGFGVTRMPAGPGADLASTAGLKAWATSYCNAMQFVSCDTFTDRTYEMCLAVPSDPCRPAILLKSAGTNPADDGEFAIFGDWKGVAAGAKPESVITIGVARGDTYPGAAQYGGAVELLKSVISTMGVTAP